MAIPHPLALLVDDSTDNVDLVQRYCPGLEGHAPLDIARHIHTDPTECWPWDRYISVQGYGKASTQPTSYGFQASIPIHRYMYDALVGVINAMHHVHHRCQNRACWNPFHLEEVTPKEHRQRHFL